MLRAGHHDAGAHAGRRVDDLADATAADGLLRRRGRRWRDVGHGHRGAAAELLVLVGDPLAAGRDDRGWRAGGVDVRDERDDGEVVAGADLDRSYAHGAIHKLSSCIGFVSLKVRTTRITHKCSCVVTSEHYVGSRITHG